jgi:hypothetical protein
MKYHQKPSNFGVYLKSRQALGHSFKNNFKLVDPCYLTGHGMPAWLKETNKAAVVGSLNHLSTFKQ